MNLKWNSSSYICYQNAYMHKTESKGIKSNSNKTNKVLKKNAIQFFDKIFFFKYRTRQIKTTNKKVTYIYLIYTFAIYLFMLLPFD